MNCDFCYAKNPTRAYDAGSEIRLRVFVESGPQVGPCQVFDRLWAACERCGDLIDRGWIDKLRDLVFKLHKLEMVNLIPAD